MKIYQVSYLDGEDYKICEYFTDKSKAEKRHKFLSSIEHTPEDFEDETDVEMVFDLSDFEVEISKKGILEMLNSRF